MAISLNVTFDLVTSAPDGSIGNIRLSAVAAGESPVGNFKVYWGVVGPDGIDHKTFPSTPDAEFADGSSADIYVRIPKDSSGIYLPGDYEIRILLTDSDDPATNYSVATLDVPFQPYNSGNNPDTHVTLTLEADYNCDTGNITALATLETDEGDFAASEEIISVTPESDTGESVYSDSDFQILAGFAIFYHTNADYTVEYSAVFSWVFGVENTYIVTIIENVSISETLNVQCVLPDICRVASCLEKEFKRLDAKVCGKGWEALSEKEKGKFNKAVAIARMILLYRACANDTKYRQYVTDFEALMDCSCGCGDSTTTADDPIPYSAPNLFID